MMEGTRDDRGTLLSESVRADTKKAQSGSEPMERKTHWDEIYLSKKSEELSWFQPEPTTSLRLIDAAGLKPTS
jgi:hypothetical protein